LIVGADIALGQRRGDGRRRGGGGERWDGHGKGQQSSCGEEHLECSLLLGEWRFLLSDMFAVSGFFWSDGW